MLRYSKKEQLEKRRERLKKLIDHCGGEYHLAKMLGEGYHTAKIKKWHNTGVPKRHIKKIQDHPGIPPYFGRVYLLAKDKVRNT